MGHLLKTVASFALPIAGAALGPETFGLSTLAGGALGGGLGGAAGGLINGGGIGSALKGAALGAGGGALANGGLSALGNGISDTLNGTIAGDAFDSLSNGISDAYNGISDGINGVNGAGSNLEDGTFLPVGQAQTLPNGLQSGSGLATGTSNAPLYNIGGGSTSSFGSGGDITNQFAKGLSDTTGYAPSANIAALSPSSVSDNNSISSLLGKYALPLAGAATSLGSNLAAQQQLKTATNKANAQLSPYLQTGGAAEGAVGNYLGLPGSTGTGGSSADILAASPGYQFSLDQGNRALAAQQAASGSLNSGAAMKAAQQFGTGLANQTSQQYLNNLQNTAGTGLSASGQYGNNTTAMGSAGANADIATGNTLSQLLSGVGGKRVIGYGTNGQPIYSSSTASSY